MSLAGDLDLVVGNDDGFALTYMENTGTSTAPVFVQRTGGANPFDAIDAGWKTAPALGDLDNDGTLIQCPLIDKLRVTARFLSLAGDLDLVVGDGDGLLNYIENTGTSTAPVFVVRTGSANPFDGIDVGGYSAPALGDIDNDGTLIQCPSIDTLRPHVLCRSQATWTSSWAITMAISTTWRTPGRLQRRRSC